MFPNVIYADEDQQGGRYLERFREVQAVIAYVHLGSVFCLLEKKSVWWEVG